MKKFIILVLFLGLLLTLLSSCEMFVPDQAQTPNYAVSGGETGSPGEPEDSAGPAENVAGGVDEYGFTVFPAGNYLADKKFDTNEFLPDYDADPSFIQFLSTSTHALCRTEDTIYSCRTGLNTTNLIMYADKATGISSPLCGRPECLHNDTTCNAYVSSFADGLCVYDGKLYWVNGRANITRMNLDGTGRETVASVGNAYSNISGDYGVVFHRGYLYVAGSRHQVIENGAAMGSVTISAKPLDGGESFTILHKLVDGSGPECLIKPVGNDLYIMLYYYNYENVTEAGFEGGHDTVEFYRWDSKTRQVEFLSRTQNSWDVLSIGSSSFHPVPGDGIYFQAYISAGSGNFNNVIYKYSFETDTYEEGAWINGYDYLLYCKDFIITDHDRTVYTFDYDGSLLFSSSRLEGHIPTTFIGADSEFAYYYCIPAVMREGVIEIEHEDYIAVPLNGGDVIAIG